MQTLMTFWRKAIAKLRSLFSRLFRRRPRPQTMTTLTALPPDRYSPDPTKISAAEAAIAQFAQSPLPGVWPFLDKATLLVELRDRVQNPFQVSQGGQPFCGPAVVLFELVRTQPVKYVQFCESLFNTGQFHGKTKSIVASEKLRHASRGNLLMSQVDWMVLATMRESENRLFPVEPNAPELIRNLAGMTKSWELMGWIREILDYPQVKYNQAYLFNDLSALQEASDTLQAGGIAIALITAETLLQNKPMPPLPTHWIGILGGVQIDRRQVHFDLYTWSQKLTLSTDLESFRKYFWLTITALP
jgi:hypothetical protein